MCFCFYVRPSTLPYVQINWTVMERSDVQIFSMVETQELFLISLGTPACENVNRPVNEEAVFSARRWFHYCQMLDKNSGCI